MAKRKKDGRVNNGRPSKGLSEVEVKIRMPRNLLDAVDRRAVLSGNLRSQWIRETLRERIEREVLRELALELATREATPGRQR